MRVMISICVMIYVGIFAQEKPEFRIRTITAGINLKSVDDLVTIKSAITFLQSAKSIYESNGYEVQTLRIATQNFQQYKGKQNWIETIESLRKIDHILDEAGVIIALGQVIESDQEISEVPEWAATLIRKTNHINFSMQIATPQTGIHLSTIRTAAKTMIALSTAAPRGEGNFRFTATANLPATTPFYPAAWHKGKHSFAIGLESPKLLMKAFRNADLNQAKDRLTKLMNRQLKPVEKIARSIASEDWQYDGIDTSPAPSPDASIGEAIEILTGEPFGSPSTLSACAMITGVLKNLDIKSCGYSGLMLPVIEDKILAKRSEEKRYTVQELLLYSAVSGTGLDVIPLAGDTKQSTIEALLTDVASLALKYEKKALSARLFIIPGKKAGDAVTFDNPFLTNSRVMSLD